MEKDSLPPTTSPVRELGSKGLFKLVSVIGALATTVAALVGPASAWIRQNADLELARQQQQHAIRMDFLEQIRESGKSPEERRDVLTFFAEVLTDERLKQWAQKELSSAHSLVEQRDKVRQELVQAKLAAAQSERRTTEAEASIALGKLDAKTAEAKMTSAELEASHAHAVVREKLQALAATNPIEQRPLDNAALPSADAPNTATREDRYVQVGSISGTDGSGLIEVAKRYESEGFSASVYEMPSGDRHLVALGPYSATEAATVASTVRRQGKQALVTEGRSYARRIYPARGPVP